MNKRSIAECILRISYILNTDKIHYILINGVTRKLTYISMTLINLELIKICECKLQKYCCQSTHKNINYITIEIQYYVTIQNNSNEINNLPIFMGLNPVQNY